MQSKRTYRLASGAIAVALVLAAAVPTDLFDHGRKK